MRPQPTEAQPVALLLSLTGVGPEFAASLWTEGLSRSFANRRQAGGLPGLTPTPWRSGKIAHEQGVSKAGNPRLRTKMLQLAWLWLRSPTAVGVGAVVSSAPRRHDGQGGA